MRTYERMDEIIHYRKQKLRALQTKDSLLANTTPLVPILYEREKGITSIQNNAYIDFADRYIGGYVLSRGCAQEEILFIRHPECCVSIGFFPVMDEHDAISFENVLCVGSNSGYMDSFRFKSPIVSQGIIVID